MNATLLCMCQHTKWPFICRTVRVSGRTHHQTRCQTSPGPDWIPQVAPVLSPCLSWACRAGKTTPSPTPVFRNTEDQAGYGICCGICYVLVAVTVLSLGLDRSPLVQSMPVPAFRMSEDGPCTCEHVEEGRHAPSECRAGCYPLHPTRDQTVLHLINSRGKGQDLAHLPSSPR